MASGYLLEEHKRHVETLAATIVAGYLASGIEHKSVTHPDLIPATRARIVNNAVFYARLIIDTVDKQTDRELENTGRKVGV